MSEKHTPNWVIGTFTRNELTIPIHEARNGHPIVRVWGVDSEAQERARLISAAPELLEALTETLAAFEAFASEVDWGKSFLQAATIRAANEAPGRARAAISKATGGPQ